MKIEFVAPLQRGWERMKLILFDPFDLGKWLVMAFSLWLARLASGGGGGGNTWNVGDGPDPSGAVHGFSEAWSKLIEHAIWIPLIILIVLVIVAVVVVLVWISSRGRFIFLDNVVHNRAGIVEPWTRLRDLGNSLFLWRIGFGLVILAAIGVMLLVILGPAIVTSSHDALKGLSIAAIVVAVFFILVVSVVASLVSLFLDSFVIPIMYRYDKNATTAWRAFLPWLKQYPAYFVLYALFVLLLLIALGVATLLACTFTCCLVVIPFAGSYLLSVLLLPLWVTYRAFSIEFLAQFDAGFDVFAAAERDELVIAGADESEDETE